MVVRIFTYSVHTFFRMQGEYVIFLETNLASNSYRYFTKDQVVPGDEDSYIVLPFSAEVTSIIAVQ